MDRSVSLDSEQESLLSSTYSMNNIKPNASISTSSLPSQSAGAQLRDSVPAMAVSNSSSHTNKETIVMPRSPILIPISKKSVSPGQPYPCPSSLDLSTMSSISLSRSMSISQDRIQGQAGAKGLADAIELVHEEDKGMKYPAWRQQCIGNKVRKVEERAGNEMMFFEDEEQERMQFEREENERKQEFGADMDDEDEESSNRLVHSVSMMSPEMRSKHFPIANPRANANASGAANGGLERSYSVGSDGSSFSTIRSLPASPSLFENMARASVSGNQAVVGGGGPNRAVVPPRSPPPSMHAFPRAFSLSANATIASLNLGPSMASSMPANGGGNSISMHEAKGKLAPPSVLQAPQNHPNTPAPAPAPAASKNSIQRFANATMEFKDVWILE